MTPSWRISTAIVIAIAVNIILVALYVWSRGGQTTTVRIEARGEEFRAYIDGKLTLNGPLPAPETGGLSLTVYGTDAIPSLPSSSSLDRIVVTDLRANQVLLEENFDDPALPGWQLGSNQVTADVSDGLLRPGPSAFDQVILDRVEADYGDVSIELTYHNITRAAVELRTQTGGRGIEFYIEPFRDSHAIFTSQPTGEILRITPVELHKMQTIKSMIAMVLRPYPWVLSGLAALTLLALAVLALPGRVQIPARLSRGWSSILGSPWLMVAMANFVFAIGLILIYRYGGAIPHWPDAVAYVWQAKIFASGRIAADPPVVPPSFDFFFPPLIVVEDGRWSSIFPYGNSLVLTPGEIVGAPWIIPPIVGALSLALLWASGRCMYGSGAAVLACVLFATSPFVLMQSSNFMSHSTAVFLMLAALYCSLRSNAGQRPMLFAVLAGVAFGLMFGTRPLPAASVALPFAAVFVASTWPRTLQRENALRAGAILGGVGIALMVFLLFNYGTTGNPIESTYRDGNLQRLGFDGTHTLALGLQNQQAQLATLLLVLQGWPQYVGLAFVLLPLVLVSRNAWDWFCGGCALLLITGPILFAENGIMQGPRLWYEAVPFLCWLAARGALLAAAFATTAAGAIWQRLRAGTAPSKHEDRSTFVTAVAVAVVLALVSASVYGWLLGQRPAWDVQHVPASPADLRHFNDVDDRIARMSDQGGLEHALVLVKACAHWQCYGSVFWRNNVTLDGSIVYARDIADQNAALLAAYPDRRVFVADYELQTLVPYGAQPERAPPIPIDPTRAPFARDIVVTPVATP